MQCPSCHMENVSDAFYCASCGAQLKSGAPGFTEYAGFWKRFGAVVLDTIIISIVNSIVMAMVGVALGVSMAASGTGMNSGAFAIVWVAYGLSIVLNWLYFTLMESSEKQATLGKMALGIIVTDVHGQRISWLQANIRYWSKIISGMILLIGYIMAGFTERKQALHDMIASTLVVDK